MASRFDRSGLLLLLAGAVFGAVVVTTVSSFASQTNNPSNIVTAANDFRAPTVSTTVISKTTGYSAGFIKQGGTYRVYANVTDTGNPASGISTVTADVSNLTTGQTATALSSGSFSAEGVSYNYRSGSLTANGSLSAGSKTYSITSTDNASNSGTQSGFTVTVDNTTPTGSDIQTANNNTIVGRAQITDTITYTFSEPMDPDSILSGWTGASTNVVVRMTNGLILLGNDGVEIYNAADSSRLPLGQIDLGRGDYVGGLLGGEIARFGATGTASTMVMSGSTITITLGTASGQAATTASGTGQMSWSPSTTPFDRAGNTMSGTDVNESGGADKEF